MGKLAIFDLDETILFSESTLRLASAQIIGQACSPKDLRMILPSEDQERIFKAAAIIGMKRGYCKLNEAVAEELKTRKTGERKWR